MNETIKSELKTGVAKIAEREVPWTENLYSKAIDSLSLVEIINLVEEIGSKHSLRVDIDALISEDTLTLDDIYKAFEKAPKR